MLFFKQGRNNLDYVGTAPGVLNGLKPVRAIKIITILQNAVLKPS